MIINLILKWMGKVVWNVILAGTLVIVISILCVYFFNVCNVRMQRTQCLSIGSRLFIALGFVHGTLNLKIHIKLGLYFRHFVLFPWELKSENLLRPRSLYYSPHNSLLNVTTKVFLSYCFVVVRRSTFLRLRFLTWELQNYLT